MEQNRNEIIDIEIIKKIWNKINTMEKENYYSNEFSSKKRQELITKYVKESVK